MTAIRAFPGFLVSQQRAREVVSPAYDSVSPEQRRDFADRHPENFLNTMRLLEDFPEDRRPGPQQLLELNKANLDRLLHNGAYREFTRPGLFLYQLRADGHVQTGVVCEVGVDEYESGRLRRHENTRSDKEDLLTDYQKVVGASSSPICLTYKQNPAIDDAVGGFLQHAPELDFHSEDGVHQRIWRIEDEREQAQLQSLFSEVEMTYLTDGHHRAASGLRYAEWMRAQHGNNGDEPYNQLLVALFPDNQLNLLPFHRCARNTGGLGERDMAAALEKCFSVEKLDGQDGFEPARHGEFGMYVNGAWYRLTVRPGYLDASDPVNSLDVVLLQNLVLDPVLGIRDSRGDPRLDYVAGVSGHEGVMRKYNEGWDVIFVCRATSIEQLMNVADAGELMPPKSTYFDPKPRSGIFVRLK